MVGMSKLQILGRRALVALRIGYFDGELHRLSLSGSEFAWQPVQDNQTFTPNILVVGRAFYDESCQSYPIDNRKEVGKLLRLELETQTGRSAAITYPAHEGKVSSNSWRFSDDVPNAKQIVPESVLLAWGLPSLVAKTVTTDNTELYFVRTVNGLVSSIKGGLISDINSFAVASGISLASVHHTQAESPADGHAQQIAHALPKLFAHYPTAFTSRQPLDQDRQLNLLRLGVGAACGFVAYLAISSAYLSVTHYQLTEQIDAQRQSVNLSLDAQTRFNQINQQLKTVNQFIRSQQSARTPLWQVIEPLMQQAQIKVIRYRNDKYTLSGETQQATQLLELLSQSDLVSDAKFDRPVRQSRNSEVFSISFSINNPAAEVQG